MAQRGNALIFSFVAQDKFTQVAAAISNKLSKFGKVAAVGVAAVSVVAAKGAQAFLEFDDAMNESLAIMGQVAGPMRHKMEEAAKAVGRTTRFSATEAAEGFFFLASAGFDAQKTLSALPVVARFAQAGLIDMATATELLVDAQNAMGLKSADTVQNIKNLTRVSDVLTKANVVSNATIEEMAQALTNKAAPALRVMNKDVEEGVAVLAALASQGLKGKAAGLSLSIVLRELSRRAITHADAFEEANIAVFDSQGKMRNLGVIIGELETRFAGMSDEQLRADLMMLGFTDRSIQVILNLLGTSEAIKQYEKDLRDAGGTTEDIANNQLKSFQAKLDIIKSHAEQAAMVIGESLVTSIFGLGEVVVEAVRMFGDLPEGIQTAVKWVTALSLGIPIMVGVLKGATSAVETLYIKFLLLSRGAQLAVATMGAIGAVLAAGAIILGIYAKKNVDAKHRVDQLAESLDRKTGALTDSTRETAVAIAQDRGLLDAADELGISTERVIDAMLGDADAKREVADAAQQAVQENIGLTEEGKELADQYDVTAGAGESLAFATENLGSASTDTKAAADKLTGGLNDQSEELDEAQRKTRQASDALGETEEAEDDLETQLAETTGAVEDQTDVIQDLIDDLDDMVTSVYAVRDADRDWEEQLDNTREAIKENGATLDITTEKGRANEEQLDQLAQSALDQAKANLENGESHEDVRAKMEKARKKFIELGIEMGLEEEQAEALADELGLIPGNYEAVVEVETTKANQKIAAFLTKIREIPKTVPVEFAGSVTWSGGFGGMGGAGGMDAGKGGVGFPLPRGSYRVGSPYGPRAGGFHTGQDFPAPIGTPVFAPFSGSMFKADQGNRSYGKYVGISSGNMTFIGAHLSRFGRTAGSVRAGQVVGYVGSTGRSTGPHLHAEFRRNGQHFNPRQVMAFAKGGFAKAGQLALVGEQGPELVKFPTRARVITNRDSQRMVSEADTRPIIIENHIEIGGEVVRVVRTEIETDHRNLKRKVGFRTGGPRL
jgi:TP901 family phage tail tape measure protein